MWSYWQFFITWIVIHCYHCGAYLSKVCNWLTTVKRMTNPVCWCNAWTGCFLGANECVGTWTGRILYFQLHIIGWSIAQNGECVLEHHVPKTDAYAINPVTCLTQYFKGTISIQYSPCGVCGGPNGTATGFSLSTLVFPFRYHSTNAPHSLIHLSQTLYNLKNCSALFSHTHIYIDKYQFPQTWDSDS